jgi:DHA2 family multidrug resistance protein-like MFS transporter
MAMGSAVIAVASINSGYGILFVALILIGPGYLAVVTAVADVILSSLPKERAGSAAAVNGAAIQIGGAFGIVVFVSIFLSAARPEYFGRLATLGLSVEELRGMTRTWRDATHASFSNGDRVLPEAFRSQFKDAWHYGFVAGIDRIFAVSAILSFLCSALIWFGVKPVSREEEKAHANEPVPKPA